MKIIDFNKMKGFPYEERHKNILYSTDEFKIRIIDLPENGKLPDCEMQSHVVFVVIKGQVSVKVNGEEFSLSENQSMVSVPATFSMNTIKGAKLMGIQIQKHLTK